VDGRTDGHTDGRTDGNVTPILLGRLPNFGSRPKNGWLASLASNPVVTVPILELWAQMGYSKSIYRNNIKTTSTIVFYRTRVYQMQPRNGQNWHFSVGKYVHHNRETAKIRIRTPLKLYVYFRFVS